MLSRSPFTRTTCNTVPGCSVGSKSRCPVLFTRDLSGFSFQPVDPRRLADGGFRVLVRRIGIVVGAVEKWESLVLGISKGRWERWKTGVWFSTVSTGPAFPRLSVAAWAGAVVHRQCSGRRCAGRSGWTRFHPDAREWSPCSRPRCCGSGSSPAASGGRRWPRCCPCPPPARSAP